MKHYLFALCLFIAHGQLLHAQAPPLPPAPAPGLTISESADAVRKQLTLTNIPPMTGIIDPSRASWNYFWMFEDGSFAKDNTTVVEKSFPSNQNVTVVMRGRYHDGKEPPLRTVITSGGGSGTKLTSVLDEKGIREDSIHPNINAARLGDSLFFAIVVRNRSETTRSGNVLLRYPVNNFEYKGQVYPRAGITALSGEQSHPLGVATLNGAIRTWQIDNMARGEERSFFVCLTVNPDADTTSMHIIAIDLQWDGDADNSTPYPYLFPTESAPPQEGRFFTDGTTESATVNFKGDSYTTIRINRARDPNGMLVFPAIIPPAPSSPAHAFRYETHVENLGSASATHLGVANYMSPLLNYSTFDYLWKAGFNFPFIGSTTMTVQAFQNVSDSIKWNFTNANLQGVTPTGSSLNKASYMLNIRMKTGLLLREGDKIPAYMIASMISPGNVVDDWEKSDPVYIHVNKPPRLPYGTIIGAKAYTFLKGKDSVGTRGLALTARLPLFRPRQYLNANGELMHSPHLFWQFEAGFGQGTQRNTARTERYSTRYVQITPAQLRYIQPIIAQRVCVGLSAAYNLAYVYDGRFEGRSVTVPSAFSNRLEHEGSVSVSLQNDIDVPSLTLGFGHNFRRSRYFGATQRFDYPFVYAQLDVVRLACRFAKVWNRVYRW